MTMNPIRSTLDVSSACIETFDVLIVGAGPSGTSAAFHLGQHARVLLVDKHHFPRPKACGDAVMFTTFSELTQMQVIEQMSLFQMTNNVAMWKAGIPLGSNVSPGYVAPRRDFDALLLQAALRQKGVNWLSGVSIHGFSAQGDHALCFGSCEGQRVQLKAKIVIAADGSGSRLARLVREAQQTPQEALTPPYSADRRFTAIRGYFTGGESNFDQPTLEFYFGEEEGIHYGWIFPVNESLSNVGVIASQKQLQLKNSLPFSQALTRFVARHGDMQQIGELLAAPLATGLRGTALYSDNILVVGDAAALIEPEFGEGITHALWSGRTAAQVVLEAFKKEDYSHRELCLYGEQVRQRYAKWL